MPPLTPARLPRSTTDRLLDGGTGPEPLRQLLAAAAAPAQADELGGEQAARLAFTTSAGSRPLPDVAAHNFPRRTRALSWIVAAKAIAAIALTAGAGGVAVAATSGSLPTRSTGRVDPPGVRSGLLHRAAHSRRRSGARHAQQPDTEPAPESSPGPPESARRDRTESGEARPRPRQQHARISPARRRPTRHRTTARPRPGPRSPPATPSTPPDRRTATRNRPRKHPPASRQEKENNGNGQQARKRRTAE